MANLCSLVHNPSSGRCGDARARGEHPLADAFFPAPEPAGAPRLGRDFWTYVTGQVVSIAGDRIALIALVFLIVRLSHAFAPALAMFYVARTIPTLLGGLVVGVIADHTQRKRLMVGADMARAALLALVPTLAHVTLWTLYPIVFVLYGVTLLFDTAARAAVPDVVPEERLPSANAILNTIDTAGDLFYVVGGTLVITLGEQLPFYLDALSFLFSALMVSITRIPHRMPTSAASFASAVRLLREGVSHLRDNPYLKWTTVAFAIVPLAGGGVIVLTPLYAARVLSHTPHLTGPLRDGIFRFSILEVTLGAGALLGGLLAVRLTRWLKRGAIVGLGFTGVGLGYSALGFTDNLYAAAIITALTGVFSSLFVVMGMTLTQVVTPSELRGRVISARLTVANAALAVGAGLAGTALVALSYQRLWLVLGTLIVVGSLTVWLPAAVRNQE